MRISNLLRAGIAPIFAIQDLYNLGVIYNYVLMLWEAHRSLGESFVWPREIGTIWIHLGTFFQFQGEKERPKSSSLVIQRYSSRLYIWSWDYVSESHGGGSEKLAADWPPQTQLLCRQDDVGTLSGPWAWLESLEGTILRLFSLSEPSRSWGAL